MALEIGLEASNLWESKTMENLSLIIGLGAAVLMLIVLVIIIFYGRLLLKSWLTGAGIGLMDFIGMTFRRVRSDIILQAKIMAVQAGIDESTGLTGKSLEAHYLAGGNVLLVVRAMIAANKARIVKLTFNEATAIDLAGRNVLEAVQTSVYPKVIDCPRRGSAKDTLDALAKDGIQLKVRARVTVRANLQRLIGGAAEETIIARVGQGIVSAIGSADSYLDVLENPDLISRAVLSQHLDSQTAYEIVSIDIADIDVGENIGARLQADQAEADTRVARARAEGRRAMAVAAEQEQFAEIEHARSVVLDAEAEVPKAMAEAFRSGRLGIMDYYKLRNIQADTDMRRSIAKVGQSA